MEKAVSELAWSPGVRLAFDGDAEAECFILGVAKRVADPTSELGGVVPTMIGEDAQELGSQRFVLGHTKKFVGD